jgi:hypothetical protein
MTETLKFLPPRVPLVDPRTGLISREWYLFFQGLFVRAGGSVGSSTTDLSASMFEDAGTEEVKAALYKHADDMGQLPPSLSLPAQDDLQPTQQLLVVFESILSELQAQRDQMAELSKVIQGLQQNAPTL